MPGRMVVQYHHYGEGVELTELEGGEVMLEVDVLSLESTDDVKDLAIWLLQKANEIDEKYKEKGGNANV